MRGAAWLWVPARAGMTVGGDRVLATHVIPDLFRDPLCLDVDAARVEGWMPELVRHDG
jgi:hypothetical protein